MRISQLMAETAEVQRRRPPVLPRLTRIWHSAALTATRSKVTARRRTVKLHCSGRRSCSAKGDRKRAGRLLLCAREPLQARKLPPPNQPGRNATGPTNSTQRVCCKQPDVPPRDHPSLQINSRCTRSCPRRRKSARSYRRDCARQERRLRRRS